MSGLNVSCNDPFVWRVLTNIKTVFWFIWYFRSDSLRYNLKYITSYRNLRVILCWKNEVILVFGSLWTFHETKIFVPSYLHILVLIDHRCSQSYWNMFTKQQPIFLSETAFSCIEQEQPSSILNLFLILLDLKISSDKLVHLFQVDRKIDWHLNI